MPIPRPSAGSTASGIEMIRISTKTAASAPSASTSRLSGTDGGSSNPVSRSATITTTASPTKNTSLPRTPLCQPITDSFTPTPDPAYQSMNEDSARIEPGDPRDSFARCPETARDRTGIAARRVAGAGALEVEEVRRFHGRKYGQEPGRRVFERSP